MVLPLDNPPKLNIILLNKTNAKVQGFEYLIDEINEQYFKGIIFPDNKILDNNNDLNNTTNSTIIGNQITRIQDGLDFSQKAQNYQFLKIIDIVEEHKNTVEFIKELSNGYFISGGTDFILKIYDKELRLLKEIKDIPEWIYSCVEKSTNQKGNDHKIELIACCNKIIYQIFISFKEEISYSFLKFEFPNLASRNCVQMKDNNFVIIGLNNSSYFIDLFNTQNAQVRNSIIVSGKSYIGCIKINQNIIAMTSNRVKYYGEDKLIFFNTDKKKISREIEGFSFTSGINGLALMPREEIKVKNKILLCACTKYFDDQKNGIYLANPQLEDKQEVNNPFYDTGNFQVFCFCPILNINPGNEISDIKKEKKIIDTEFFLVGGFNEDKKEGEIKLYKVIYAEKAIDNKIEFIQDIEFERNSLKFEDEQSRNKEAFSGFEGAVNCIIQTKKEKSGFILVTCYNGKIYLLTPPNLDKYLKKENEK